MPDILPSLAGIGGAGIDSFYNARMPQTSLDQRTPDKVSSLCCSHFRLHRLAATSLAV
jgi:hypothetical protein